MSILGYFDKVYCIHLPQQEERLTLLKPELKRVGIDYDTVQFIHAEPPPEGFSISNVSRSSIGEFGCNLSQIKAIVKAIKDQAQRPLFIEDDIIFVENANERLTQFFNVLPSDWDVLYFGGHPRGEYNLIKPNIAKVSKFSFAESYSIRGELLFDYFSRWANKISRPKAPYDFILGDYASNVKSYCIYPIITKQRAGYSDIIQGYDDKSYLIKTRWKKWRR